MFGVSHFTDYSVLLKALGFGYAIGAIFCLFNCFIKKISNTIIKSVFDAVFFISVAFIGFVFVFVVNYGLYRGYILVFFAIGFCLFMFLPAKQISAFMVKLMKKLKHKKKMRCETEYIDEINV